MDTNSQVTLTGPDDTPLPSYRTQPSPPIAETILNEHDRDELRHLEEEPDDSQSGVLNTLLERHPDLDLTGRVHVLNTEHPIPGGYSDVVKGYYVTTTGAECRVAVKRLRIHTMQDGEFQRKLARELYVWSKLKNSRILPLEGFFLEDNSFPSLVSRWMENGTVLKYLGANPHVNLLSLVVGIAEGITYLHLNNIVHSDIKPDNVLISDSGEPLLCDFGVSRMLSASRSFKFSSSLTGGLRGTLRFMSRELLTATDLQPATYSKASDVWAFGMTILSILTRQPPYHEIGNDVQVINAITNGKLPSQPPELISWPAQNQLLWRICNFCWTPVAIRRSMQTLTLELQMLEQFFLHASSGTPDYQFQFLRVNPENPMSNNPNSRDELRINARRVYYVLALLLTAAILIPIAIFIGKQQQT